MRAAAVIIAICWIVFWLYWIVSAFGAKQGSNSNLRQFVRVRIGIVTLAAIVALLFNRLPQSFRNHALGSNGIVLALGLLIFFAGLVLAVWARVYLGKNWGMPMTRKQNPELVTDGPYQYIRHPIYTGILLMALGSAMDVNSYWLLVFVVSAVYCIYSAVAEERLMLQQFPKTYPAYKAKTKMLLPFVL